MDGSSNKQLWIVGAIVLVIVLLYYFGVFSYVQGLLTSITPAPVVSKFANVSLNGVPRIGGNISRIDYSDLTPQLMNTVPKNTTYSTDGSPRADGTWTDYPGSAFTSSFTASAGIPSSDILDHY